jgi:hypothetical protein
MESTSIVVIVFYFTPPILIVPYQVRDCALSKEGATNGRKIKLGKAWA